ncbi:unnamed protein product, partial [Symbiodinium sp. KB8]
AIDANNSGAVSTYEFDSALRLRLGLDYEAITGLKLRSLFKEFDTRHCGLVYGVDMVSAFAHVWRRYGIPEEVARDPLLNPDMEGPAHDEVLREQQRWLRETRRPASPRSARSRQRSSSPQAEPTELRTPRSDILNQKASVSPRIRDEWDRGYRTVGIPASPRSPRNLALPGVTSRRVAMDFEIDIKKVSWVPTHVEEIAEVASKAFECPMTFEELQETAYGVIGTDHIEKVQINEDSDIPKFVAIKTKTRFEEKVIKFRLPERAVTPSFQPKKTKALVKGSLCAKFFGECEVSTRSVEFTIKLYDCGHFYMKQTLPGSGASPYWVIFEGRWERTERGLAFEYLFRYAWQVAKTRLMPEFALEAVPKNHRSRLAWCGEMPEQQLNGNVPAIVGEDAFCWIEICREPDKVERGKARFNEEEDDIIPQKDEKEELRRRPARSAAPATPSASEKPAAESPAATATTEDSKDDEPMWPLYAGLGVLLVLLIFFFQLTWDSKTQVL